MVSPPARRSGSSTAASGHASRTRRSVRGSPMKVTSSPSSWATTVTPPFAAADPRVESGHRSVVQHLDRIQCGHFGLCEGDGARSEERSRPLPLAGPAAPGVDRKRAQRPPPGHAAVSRAISRPGQTANFGRRRVHRAPLTPPRSHIVTIPTDHRPGRYAAAAFRTPFVFVLLESTKGGSPLAPSLGRAFFDDGWFPSHQFTGKGSTHAI